MDPALPNNEALYRLWIPCEAFARGKGQGAVSIPQITPLEAHWPSRSPAFPVTLFPENEEPIQVTQ